MAEFTRQRFSEILQACHDIIRNNDKLSPEASFDEISKILFVKILKERTSRQIYSKDSYLQEQEDYEHSHSKRKYFQILFEQVKNEYKAENVFNDYETIRVRETSFIQIIEKLETYNLSEISDDLKGIAFEQFLGKTFRGELGQFFTPRNIVDFMVSCIDPKEGELICDPCCGSGGFLIKSFEYIKEKIVTDENFGKEDIQNRLRNLAQNCIFGTDANPRMARTSKMNMIMHGDGHSGIHLHDGLLNVNGIFENRFDVVLTNPPFGAKVSKNMLVTNDDRFTDEEQIEKYINQYGDQYKDALRQVNDHIGKPILELFSTGRYSGGGLTEALFVERSLNLLKPGGRLGIVLPEGILSNNILSEFRNIIEGMARIVAIVSLPKDTFTKSGASVKTSIVFMKKFSLEDKCKYDNCVNFAEQECLKHFVELPQETLDSKLKGNYLQTLSRQQKDQYKMEVKAKIKQMFNYPILISSIDVVCESAREAEVKELQDYFVNFIGEHQIWEL